METHKKNSRKWRLVKYVLFISTFFAFIPPIVSQWVFKDKTTLFLLPAASYVALITLIISAYFGANVVQKNILKNNDNETKTTITVDKNEDGEA